MRNARRPATAGLRRAALLVTAALLLAACSSGTGQTGAGTTTDTSAAPTAAQPSSTTTGAASAAVLAATQEFLGTLDDTQRTTVMGERTAANLAQWSNLPDQLFTRAGLRMDGLNDTQKAAVDKILQAALSPEGYTQVTQITTADGVLATQRKLLLDLVDEWITPLTGEEAAAKLAAVEQNLDRTTFAWYGSTQIGNPIYYRVQGPTFTIEFAHQQGQGANAGGITQIHSIYREPGNDYGAQLT